MGVNFKINNNMKRIIYRFLADYYYKRAFKYEFILKTMENQKGWIKYLRNTGSIAMRKEACLKKAYYFIEKL